MPLSGANKHFRIEGVCPLESTLESTSVAAGLTKYGIE